MADANDDALCAMQFVLERFTPTVISCITIDAATDTGDAPSPHVAGPFQLTPSSPVPPAFTLSITRAVGDGIGIQSGLYLWPAASALACFLLRHWASLEARVMAAVVPAGAPLRIVEVGAGVGLTGLALAAHLKSIPNPVQLVLTDRDDNALSLLRANATALQLAPDDACQVRAATLDWGPAGVSMLRSLWSTFDVHCGMLSPPSAGAHLILGADVIYSLDVLDLLLWTVDQLLVDHPAALVVLATSLRLRDRAAITDRLQAFARTRNWCHGLLRSGEAAESPIRLDTLARRAAA